VSAAAVLSSVLLLGVATLTDLRSRRVPNAVVMVGLIIAVGMLAFSGADRIIPAVCAAVLTTAFLLFVRQAGIVGWGRAGLGMGDIKLSFVLGLLIGVHVAGVLYLAACLAALTGIAGTLLGRCKMTSSVPFVPFMAAGAIVYGVIIVV